MNETFHRADDLRAFASAIFSAAGWSDREAGETADHLVLANLSGHDSHGVGIIPLYIDAFDAGLLKPTNRPRIRLEAAPFLVVEGNVALGPPAANFALRQAIAMADAGGVSIVNLLGAHHVGRIGHYAEMAAEAGLISMFWVNVAGRPPIVAPHGAREARFGTNPHTMGVPCGQTPLILDFATSRMAHGKARVALNKGEPVREGYLIDHAGHPTTNPAAVFASPLGALLPFGDHKGAGIAVMAEILSAGLAAGPTMPETPAKAWVLNSLFGILIDPARLDPDGARDARVQGLADFLRSAAPRAGFDAVRAPGDAEREARAQREREGIAIDATTWGLICAAAAKVGVMPPSGYPARPTL